MSYSSKFFITLIVFGLGLISTTLAQETTLSPQKTALTDDATEAVTLDEDIRPEDLEISEPRLLPDNPFYFLKNWTRGVQSFFTFSPVKKAELKIKFSNEKLMEVKKMVKLKKDSEIIEKATENYQEEVEKIKEQTEKIKEKAKENPQVESFLDKFVHQQILHQKLLQKLETQVPPEVFEKIKETRERHLEKFQDVMLKLEDRKEKITEKLDKILEEQKGSEFKEFKNLEILKNLEEKAPEEAKEALKKAQENSLKRLKENLMETSSEKQIKFKDYLERISGEKDKQLEILENLKTKMQETPETPRILELKERLEEGKINIMEKIEERLEKMNCPRWAPPASGFCKEGRVIIEKDKNGCPLAPRCIVPDDVKKPNFDLFKCESDKDCNKLPLMRPIKFTCVKKRCKPLATTNSQVCITLWEPVCGKDSKTYSNECFAKIAGVEISYKGECKKLPPESVKPENR